MAVSLNGDGTITGLSTLDSVTITGLTSLTTTDLTADTTTLVVDSANNRVGIGTSSPLGSLSVLGGGRLVTIGDSGTANTPAITARTTADTGYAFLNISTYRTKFFTEGSERMVINESGNVGIGTSSPARKLHVVDTTASGAYIQYDGQSNAEFGLRIESNVSGGNFESDYSSGGTALLDLFANSATVTGGDLLVARTQSATPVLLVKGNGNVNIGTSAAGYGDLTLLRQATTATNATLSLVSGTSGYSRLFFGDTQNAAGEYDGFIQYDQANRLMQFGTAQAERMRIDSSGNVGIGTSSPNKQLQIQYGSTNSGQLQITNNSTGTTATDGVLFGYDTLNDVVINNQEATATKFYTNSAERMRITSAGNVGIGTSTSATKLTVEGVKTNIDLDSNGILLIRDTTAYNSSPAAGLQFSVKYNAAGTTAIGLSIQGIKENAIDGNFAQAMLFTTQAQGDSPRERMRIDSSGNVGIGTSSPTTKLHVSDTGTGILISSSSDTTNTGFSWSDGTISGVLVASGVGGTALYTQSNHPTVFGTNNTERMRIDSSGNVLIGTTGSASSNLVSVNNSGTVGLAAGQFTISASSMLSTPAAYFEKWDNNNTTSNVFVKFIINARNTGSGQINANGALAAAFGSYSDARLKENIEPLPQQLDNILALKPSEFDYKDGSGHQIGFIAQEMQEVYPDVVSEGDEGMLTITGWSKTEARLVKAIQEQQDIIKALETRIQALENQ